MVNSKHVVAKVLPLGWLGCCSFASSEEGCSPYFDRVKLRVSMLEALCTVFIYIFHATG